MTEIPWDPLLRGPRWCAPAVLPALTAADDSAGDPAHSLGAADFALSVLSSAHEGEHGPGLRDLQNSSPARDFREMLWRPRTFFARFSHPRELTWPIVCKAVVGLIVAAWLGKMAEHARLLPADAVQLWDRLDPSLLTYVEQRLGLAQLKNHLVGLWLSYRQIRVALAPTFVLADVLIQCASALLVLPLLVGSEGRHYSFFALFAAGCFVSWLRVFEVLSWVGPLVGGVLTPLYFVIAIQVMYRVSFINALVASQLFTWTLGLVGALLTMIGLFAWSLTL